MHPFDVAEAFYGSIKSITHLDCVCSFDRSPTNRANSSCNLNFRRGNNELDLLIWESFEAELVCGKVDGVISSKHIDDIRDKAQLMLMLTLVLNFLTATFQDGTTR